jgi:CRP/FNR family cyclic AMP-dependent transcriptional regulator
MTSGNWRPATLLARLPSRVRDEMAALGAERRYRAGDVLIHEGGSTREMLLLLSGYVKVSMRNGTHSVLLAVRSAGDPVGDLAAMSGEPRSATVTACTPIVARFILPETLRAFLQRHPQAAGLISGLVSARLAAANRRRVEVATRPVLDRLIGVLLDLIEVCGEKQADGAVELPSWFNQAELAALAGATSTDTVQRCLRTLRERGLIENGYRWVRIKDPDRLAAARVPPPAP